MRTTRKGFTLIELLVVIAIIAILAAILFPVFARAKLNAKHTATLSNMKQVLLASIQYSTDNDDTTPLTMDQDFWTWPSINAGVYNGWPGLFFPYLRNKDIVYDVVVGAPTEQLAARPSTVSVNRWWSYFPQIHMQFNSFPTIPLGWDPSGVWAGSRTMTTMEWISFRMAFATDEPRTVSEADTSSNPYWQNGTTFERTAICTSYTQADRGHYQRYPDWLDWTSVYMGSKAHGYQVIAGIGDGHAKSFPSKAIIYDVDTDPASGGDWGSCLAAHMDRFQDAAQVPSSKELELLKLWGKAWDRSW